MKNRKNFELSHKDLYNIFEDGVDKKDLIYYVDERAPFATYSVLTPKLFLFDEGTIREYVLFKDDQGREGMGYVEVVASDPKHFTHVLDLREDRLFDDICLLLGDILRVK